MKLLAAVALVAAFVPSVPSAPLAPASSRAPDCGASAARVRPGSPGVREPNELTPAEVRAAERDLADRLARLDRSPDGDRRSLPARVDVPVYFHVLHDGERGDVPTERIRRQIAAMNAAYGGGYGGADTGVRFRLVQVTRTDNPAWYSHPDRYEMTFKDQLRRGGAGTLNLYSADTGPDLLGWSTFPWRYRSEPIRDGVVIHHESMPGGSIPEFDRGFSAVHETGHWLGLYHTFQNGCEGEGDRVADTPPEREAAYGCPTGRDTCPGDGPDPVHNFMDYSSDTCMREFTWGQGTRIRQVWAAYRA
ncbi:zinc metalloprotease [Actinomadura rubrobrunea]|uniref:Zinc metalloprotease n=1 Tax=Actinomadura rubrobrunea TaxID=115335 RepID=A0A9W6PX91_9ACTN|nr:zinc metalloprotease [Actinomadura rubrobrunea]GLW65685.1 zinc metalloprotease [Actinomadura rubrobrunea]